MSHRLTPPNTGPDLTRRGSLALAVGGLFAASARAAPGQGPWSEVDALAAKVVEDRVTPGLSLSVRHGAAIVYSRGFGVANLETETPVTPQTVFRIGSITKQFTAAAVMLLQEDGKLSVDDTLSVHLKDFPRAGEITLRQMLNHTSGLGNYLANVPREATWQNFRLDRDSAALRRLMDGTDPLFTSPPGTQWAYSNTAYVLLGLVIEKITGEPYAATFKRRLFEPAGLIATAVDDAAEIVPHRATGYTPHAGGAPPFNTASFISMTTPGAAGNLRSTTDDLCRWHKALFGGRIVKPESLAEMVKPGRLKSGDLPPVPKGAPPTGPKVMEYGFGLETEHLYGRTAISHNGGINGFYSNIRTFRAEDVTVAILVNIDSGSALEPRTEAVQAAMARAGFSLG